MKLISLIRTDEEAEEVNISVGEAVIGRGQLLKCADKRISRNHGLITLSEKGDVILTSKHLNPIYYSEKMHPEIEIHSGHSVTLNDGDEFALLPDKFRFRVAILSDNKAQNNQNGCINGELVMDKDAVDEEVQKTEWLNIKQEVQSECLKIKQEVQSESEKLKNTVDSLDQYASNLKCVRNLPTWMTNTSKSQDVSTPGTSAVVKKERKRKDDDKSETIKKKEKVTSKKKETDECSDDELQLQKKKTRKVCDDDDGDKNEMDIDSKICSDGASVNKTKVHELSDEEEQSKDDKADAAEGTSSKAKNSDDTGQSSDQPTDPGDQNMANNNTRQKCLYGANCYRRNPQHRTDFSHPGDADYDDDNIPECPYGLHCYRKNKQHRLDYKHTTVPQQQNNPQNSKDNIVDLQCTNCNVTVNCNRCNLCNYSDSDEENEL